MPTIDEIIEKAKDKNCVIRNADTKDGSATLTVAKSAFPKTDWRFKANKVHYTNLANGIGNLFCIVIEKNSNIVGYLFYKYKNNDVYISDIGVLQSEQSGGLGRLMIAYVFVKAKDAGKQNATLYTADDSDGASLRTAYTRMNFAETSFGYTSDDDNDDTNSKPMKGSIDNILKYIESKL